MTVEKAVVLGARNADASASPNFGFCTPMLLPLANKPVLFHNLEALRSAGVRQVALVVDSDTAPDIRAAVANGSRWQLAIHYLERPAEGGLAGVVRAAREFLDGQSCLVQHGDVLVHSRLGRVRERFSRDALDALLLRLNAQARPAARLRVVGEEGDRPPAPIPPHPHSDDAGGCFLGLRALDALLAPGDPLPDLEDMLASLRRCGARVGVEQVQGSTPFSGGHDGVLAANRRLLEGLRAEYGGAEIVKSELQGPVVVHRTARLHRTLVRGPAIIGPGASLSHTFVGPYTSIGADVTLEAAEVQHSILLDGAEIRHPGQALESSIIGRGARLVRDFRPPNAMRMVLPDWAEVSFS